MRLVAFLRLRILVVLATIAALTQAAWPADSTPYNDLTVAETLSYSIPVAPPGYPRVSLYAEETGKGPVVLMLHGLGASGYTYRRIVPQLARHNRVITLDLRGFGRSDKPFDQSYSALDQAAHVKAFVARRGLRDFTLVGHSFGGGVALALALDLNRTNPGAISKLVLMNSPAFPQPLSLAVSFLRAPILPYVALNLIPPEITARMSLSSDMGNFSHITNTDITRYATPLRDPAAAHALITTAQRIVPDNLPDLVRRYPTITQRTLLIWCRADPVVPLVTGVSLKRMLPNAQLRIIDGCTHVPPEESPAEVLAHMQQFLRTR